MSAASDIGHLINSWLASFLPFYILMKQKINYQPAFIVGLTLILCLVPLQTLIAESILAQQKQSLRDVGPPNDQQAVAIFEQRVKDYVKLREQIEEKLPKLSKESTPEQIQTHLTAFEEAVRSAKAGAKSGDIFAPDIANYIRATIRREFKGKRLKNLRETILEAETKGVRVRVNYPYPQSKELTEIPPTLLLILPQLPKQVRYRFVGRHMLLVDRETHLIIDYMLDALP
jgi:hypothetical protein